MAKQKNQNPTHVVPTQLEEHLGEVWDPRNHEVEIASAIEHLWRFVEDMENGRPTEIRLDGVRKAAGTLGHYSGYSNDAYAMDCFLESPVASSSYRAVAHALPSFIRNMSDLIQARTAKLAEQSISPVVSPLKTINH